MATTFDLALFKQLLRQHEGSRRFPYADSEGKMTIGVGRNLDDVGLSDVEIDWLLGNDVARVIADLNRHLPWWRRLSATRQLVIASMCFNLGIHGLLQFKKTLPLVEAGDYRSAAAEMLKSKWAKQVGGRAVELSRMMETGEMSRPVRG